MIDIKFIRKHPDIIKEGCRKKQVKVNVKRLLEIDKNLNKYRQEYEGWKAELNKLSRSKPDKEAMEKAKDLKSQIRSHGTTIIAFAKDFQSLMLQIPNLPLDDVPVGKDERDNIVIREVGKKTKLDFKPKNYLEIAKNLDLIDVKRAAKISGTRFGFLKNEAVLLEFALINFAFEILMKKGFIPIIPPVMVRQETMEGMGHLSEENRQEKYFIEKDNLYLIGSAEQPIGAMHSGEIFEERDLPRRYLGFSTCFRREAGAYGKDTKGIFRVHQFDKIEMFSFCRPEKSKEEHQFLLSCQEKLMQLLKIPYRVMQICTGDLAFPAAAAYDIEAWLPSENRYRETHTTFNDTDFQTRRLNIRYRNSKTKKIEFAHALNGTAFAIGRILIAIIENYQKKDGSIEVPKALHKYLDFKTIPNKKG